MRPSRVLGLLAVDVVVAGVVAVLIFWIFGVAGQDDVNPPVCSNAAGGVVSCDLTQEVLMIPTFVVTLLALIIWQVVRARRS